MASRRHLPVTRESMKALASVDRFGDLARTSMVDLDLLRQLFEEFIPFNKWLGMKVEHIERGRVLASIPWRPEIVGDPTVPALHGGVIGAVADATGGVAVWTMIENPSARISTVDMRVDYLRPGKQEKLMAEGHVVRIGARLGWADIRLYHPGRESELVAQTRAVYAIKIPKHARTDG